MIIQQDYDWISISEEEYNKAYNKENPKTDSEVMNIMQEILFNERYRKDPIYKNPGFNLIGDDPEIIGYKYYKRGGPKLYIIGSVEQIKKWEKQFNKMMLDYIK